MPGINLNTEISTCNRPRLVGILLLAPTEIQEYMSLALLLILWCHLSKGIQMHFLQPVQNWKCPLLSR
jgi:hypothetical protein